LIYGTHTQLAHYTRLTVVTAHLLCLLPSSRFSSMSLLTVLALQQLLQLDEDWDHDLDQVLHDLGHHPPFGHQDPPPLPASSSISEFSDKMLRWMYIAFSDKMLRWMCISLQAGIYRDPEVQPFHQHHHH